MVVYPDFLFLVIDGEISCMIFAEAYGELEQGRKSMKIYQILSGRQKYSDKHFPEKRSGDSGRFSVTVDNCSATSSSINKILIFC